MVKRIKLYRLCPSRDEIGNVGNVQKNWRVSNKHPDTRSRLFRPSADFWVKLRTGKIYRKTNIFNFRTKLSSPRGSTHALKSADLIWKTLAYVWRWFAGSAALVYSHQLAPSQTIRWLCNSNGYYTGMFETGRALWKAAITLPGRDQVCFRVITGKQKRERSSGEHKLFLYSKHWSAKSHPPLLPRRKVWGEALRLITNEVGSVLYIKKPE